MTHDAAGTMLDVGLHDAKTHLSQLNEEAAAGEEIIIAKAGKPRARLLPLAAAKRGSQAWRLGRPGVGRQTDRPAALVRTDPPSAWCDALGEVRSGAREHPRDIRDTMQ